MSDDEIYCSKRYKQKAKQYKPEVEIWQQDNTIGGMSSALEFFTADDRLYKPWNLHMFIWYRYHKWQHKWKHDR